MQKPVAKHIVRSAYRSAAQLQEILAFAKLHCGAAEYPVVRKSVATAIMVINEEVVDKILKKHPALKREIEDSITKFGVII
jgi:hypothetical protein